MKLQGGYHRGATSTLCGRDFYYIQKGIPALPARTLSHWLGDPSKGASPPGHYLQTLVSNNIYKQDLQTIFTNNIYKHNKVDQVEGTICKNKVKKNKFILIIDNFGIA